MNDYDKYNDKYLKYKNKYLELKQYGNGQQIVIYFCHNDLIRSICPEVDSIEDTATINKKLAIDFTREKRYIAFKGINNTSTLELLLDTCKTKVDDKNPLDVYEARHTMEHAPDDDAREQLMKSYRYRNLVYKTEPAAAAAVVVPHTNQYTSTDDKPIEAINKGNWENPYKKENLRQIIKYIQLYTDTFHGSFHKVNSYIIINNITGPSFIKNKCLIAHTFTEGELA